MFVITPTLLRHALILFSPATAGASVDKLAAAAAQDRLTWHGCRARGTAAPNRGSAGRVEEVMHTRAGSVHR